MESENNNLSPGEFGSYINVSAGQIHVFVIVMIILSFLPGSRDALADESGIMGKQANDLKSEKKNDSVDEARNESGDDSEDSDALFQEALLCYGEINFDCSASKLKQAREVEISGAKDPRLLTQILRYLAYSKLALGDESGAFESFLEIFTYNHEFRLLSDKVSPKIFSIYEKAKAEFNIKRTEQERIEELIRIKREEELAEAKRKDEQKKRVEKKRLAAEKLKKLQKTAPKIKEDQSKLSDGLVKVSGLSAFLLGDDTKYYNVGFSIRAGVDVMITDGWYVGGGLVYQRHGGKSNYDDLNIAGALFQASYAYGVSRFRLHMPLAFGPSMFGKGSVSDEFAFMWRFEPEFLLKLNNNFSVGLQAGAGGVFMVTRSAASWFTTAGLLFCGMW